MVDNLMENTLTFEGKELKWDYKIVPCLECPIYPLRKDWEDDPDIRHDKCYTSHCSYDRKQSRAMAESIAFIMNKKQA